MFYNLHFLKFQNNIIMCFNNIKKRDRKFITIDSTFIKK